MTPRTALRWAEYYRRLSAIPTEGDWEAWVTFFLEGVAVAAADTERNIIEVASLVAADRKRQLQSPKAGPASYRLFEMLPTMPRFTIERVRQRLETSFPTATATVKVLEDLGMVVNHLHIAGHARSEGLVLGTNHVFEFESVPALENWVTDFK